MKGFAALGGYQCGDEGTAVQMPTPSRDIESVCGNASASRHSLRFYFSFEKILDVVIRARLAGRDDGGMLPPRKFWSRPSVRERCGGQKIEPKAVRRMAIRRRVLKCRRDGSLASQDWGRKLLAFVERVQTSVYEGRVEFAAPKMISIVKGIKDGKKTYREVASFERLEDRVVLSLATAYVRDVLDAQLRPNCYSFRKDGRITHESAVAALQQWRTSHDGQAMYVAECDIKSFFDSISHEVVRRRWREVIEARWDGIQGLSGLQVLEAYLRVYSAKGTPGRGLPQGGALSVVLANLVLAAADERVMRDANEGLFYARYCDDVVFADVDEAKCRAAMSAYALALEELDLPMHPVESFVYQEAPHYALRALPNYYEIKSKGPFRWAEPADGVANVAPWVSFLGSQIRCDGETRIRKESVGRHIRSLGRATAAAVREVQSGEVDFSDANRAAAWYARFRNRLIAKGVGYVTAKFEDCIGCWAGAFGQVTKCRETQGQMRRLDRVRENMLCKVRHALSEALKGRHRFKGNPYSYHAFLMREVKRVTNMHMRVKAKATRLRNSDV